MPFLFPFWREIWIHVVVIFTAIGAKLIRRLSLRPSAEELEERNILKCMIFFSMIWSKLSWVIKGWWHCFGSVVFGLELRQPCRWRKCKHEIVKISKKRVTLENFWTNFGIFTIKRVPKICDWMTKLMIDFKNEKAIRDPRLEQISLLRFFKTF